MILPEFFWVKLNRLKQETVHQSICQCYTIIGLLMGDNPLVASSISNKTKFPLM